jgi:hypothetical protein
LATLAGLIVMLPIDALLVVLALVRRVRKPTASPPTSFPRTVLITGGKMTKALQLARSFHCAGHRVILAESAKYRFTGHRFSPRSRCFLLYSRADRARLRRRLVRTHPL